MKRYFDIHEQRITAALTIDDGSPASIFADECGDYTPYEHCCDEYEERGDND